MALTRRLQSTFESGLQHRDRQMPEQSRELHLHCAGLADDTFHGIAFQVERTVKGVRAGPDPAALGKHCECFRYRCYHGVAAAAPREGNDMVAVRPANLQRLVIAVSECLGKLSAQFEKNFPGYSKVSEGETKVGIYDGYEFRFEGMSRNTTKGDLKLWGRLIFLPPVDGGKDGVTLLMLATSLAPELRSVNDVGAKGELPMMLESFRFGKK